MKVTYRNFEITKTKGKRAMNAQFFATVERVQSRVFRGDIVKDVEITTNYGISSWTNCLTGENIYDESLDNAVRVYLAKNEYRDLLHIVERCATGTELRGGDK